MLSLTNQFSAESKMDCIAAVVSYCKCMVTGGLNCWSDGSHKFSKGQKTRASGGVEFAYGNFNHFFHSVDGGFEFEKNKFRIYSELQTGILLTGISCGRVLEFSNTGTHVGDLRG